MTQMTLALTVFFAILMVGAVNRFCPSGTIGIMASGFISGFTAFLVFLLVLNHASR